MNADKINSITFIGAGNVAHHLALNLRRNGKRIHQVLSKSFDSAKALASDNNADAIEYINEIDPTVDLIILAVNDDAIVGLAEALYNHIGKESGIVVHTSGKIPGSIFEPYFNKYGVFYPLQSFSKHKVLEIKEVPFCLNSNHPSTLKKLKILAAVLSDRIYEVTDKERAILHLAAVFANNFSNHMYVIAEDICKDGGVNFEILQPLIKETADKIKHISPRESQTGPAIRNDGHTIAKHLKMLKPKKDLRRIYKLISQNIQNSGL